MVLQPNSLNKYKIKYVKVEWLIIQLGESRFAIVELGWIIGCITIFYTLPNTVVGLGKQEVLE